VRLRTLHRFGASAIVDALASAGRRHGLSNLFNPSVATWNGSTFIAFRAESAPADRPFRAYLLRCDPAGRQELTDLSVATTAMGAAKAADPKLVTLGSELYVTFNTGNVHHGQNDIFLQRVAPTVGPPQRCLLSGRRMVEKNWGFFLTSEGSLRALYSLSPTTILRLDRGVLGSDEPLEFVRETASDIDGRFPRLHIGSQPLRIDGDRALVAANQQVPLPGLPRKIYFGRIAELDLGTGRLSRLSRTGLVHSWRSTLPQRKRHNPGLFSATYFAGLSSADDELLVGYGINDIHFGIARVPESLLWG
jgi:hypothetical protein